MLVRSKLNFKRNAETQWKIGNNVHAKQKTQNLPEFEHKLKWHQSKAKGSTSTIDRDSSIKIAVK